MVAPWLSTLDRPLLREMALVCLADAVVGASFGSLAVAGGLPAWVPLLMSSMLFAGGAQFAFLGVVLNGGSLVAAVITGLVLNARLVLFGFTIADVLRARPAVRLLGSHLITDEAVAFVIAQHDPHKRRAVYMAFGVMLFMLWNLGTVVGVLAVRAVGDPGALGLDAAGPMVLLALVMPALRDRRILKAAVFGAGLALATTPFLPPGVPVLVALLGMPLAGALKKPSATDSHEETSARSSSPSWSWRWALMRCAFWGPCSPTVSPCPATRAG